MKASKKSWIPQRKGEHYCSPACGGGCTWAEFQKAKANGEKLAASLGAGWQARTRENLGWHYNAVHRRSGVQVYQHGPKRFWATTTGVTVPQHHATASSPLLAVRKVIRALKMSRNVLDFLLERTP